MHLSDTNSNQSYLKKLLQIKCREKADENNDDIEKVNQNERKKNTNNMNIKIVKAELKLVCNHHLLACARK